MIAKFLFEIGAEPQKKNVRCYIEYYLAITIKILYQKKKFWYKIMETPQLSPLYSFPG